jgi:thiol-disulfide isomerase/thioredoxin
MIGYGPEKENFALELTYNYGIDSYAFGNDLQYIALANPTILKRAKAFNAPIVNENIICGPDNYKYKIIPSIPGRAEIFVAVGLRVANLTKALGYWVDVLGMDRFPTPAGLETTSPSCCVGFYAHHTYLQLIEVNDGSPVDHALSSGRIAFACPDKSVPAIFAHITSCNETVQVPPLTLPTPGKADVVVTILRDRDEYEICFVEDVAFYDLATPKYDIIDFIERATRGGDGAPPPIGEKIQHGNAIVDISCQEDLDEHLALALQAKSSLLVYFGASWCKNCKKISPNVDALAAASSSVKVVTCDIAACEGFAMEHDVSNVPRFFLYKEINGQMIKNIDYLGSAEEKISALFN